MKKNLTPIRHLTQQELNILTEQDPAKIILWCGAGIGANSPSSLPCGQELAKFFLNSFIDADFARELYEKWKKATDVINDHELKLGSYFRLESIFSQISKLNKALGENENSVEFLSYQDAFKELMHTPPNQNHQLIAQLLTSGSTVVTTNYDLCIEYAARLIDQNIKFTIAKNHNSVYEYRTDKETCGSIYHIHGVAEDPQEIGVTYQNISRFFPDDFIIQLDKWIEEDYIFIFLGYSCSDNYDVERYFDTLSTRNIAIRAKAIYICHAQNEEPHSCRLTPLSDAVVKHLSAFKTAYAGTMNTLLFLEKINKNNKLPELPKPTNEFQWQPRFQKHIQINPEVKVLLFYKICRLIGINPDVFTFYAKSDPIFQSSSNLESLPVTSEFLLFTLGHIYKEQNDVDGLERLVQMLPGESEDPELMSRIEQDILEMQREFNEMSKNLPTIDEINENINTALSGNDRITWDKVSSPLHKHSKCFLHQLKEKTITMKSYKLSQADRIYARSQLTCINRILNEEFSALEDIDQYCVALRSKALLLAALNGVSRYDEIFKALNRATELYNEESSLTGIIGCLHFSAVIYFILYLQTDHYTYLLNSETVLERCRSLADTCCSEKFKTYIDELENWRISLAG